ncbi:MAG: RsiV family protein, partial [Spirochaetaceae bacterium]|nr:RsiV family protein [Spirochaetaceae bacterium]
MKHIFLFTILLTAYFFNSCAGMADKDSGADSAESVYRAAWHAAGSLPSKYTTYEKKEIIPLFPERKTGGPSLEFTVDTLDVSNGAERGLLQRILYEGLTCEDYAEKVYADIKDGYQKTTDDAESRGSVSHDWYYKEWFSGVIYPELLVISRESYVYSGGAHGENQKTYFVIDTKRLSQITLGDILKPDSGEALQKEIDGALRAKYSAPLTQAGFFADTAGESDNFFISREGLGFCWNPYDIAPYAMGVIEVVLPYDRIENLLTERGAALLANLETQRL